MAGGQYEAAAALIERASGLLITAGAGMGVDSGLPDFRGPAGFWRVYPALGRARMAFEEIACPDAFRRDAALAWGFYAHRLRLYRETVPHEGFHLLRQMAVCLAHGAFVFTSNVDGQFQKAGFAGDRVCECHGSIHRLQCMGPCSDAIWPADGFDPQVDAQACRLTSDFPACPRCASLARPNILMFGDWGWLPRRMERQRRLLDAWLGEVERLVVIEIGAGTHIPTVRLFGELRGDPLIRINPTEPEIPGPGVSMRAGGLEALRGIARVLGLPVSE